MFQACILGGVDFIRAKASCFPLHDVNRRCPFFVAGAFRAAAQAAAVEVGIDLMEDRQFAELKGRRVGPHHQCDRNRFARREHGRHPAQERPAYNWWRCSDPNMASTAPIGPGSTWRRAPMRTPGCRLFPMRPTTKPTPEMLKGIDVLVYDIQDIGCRG